MAFSAFVRAMLSCSVVVVCNAPFRASDPLTALPLRLYARCGCHLFNREGFVVNKALREHAPKSEIDRTACGEEPTKAARADDPNWRALVNLVVKVRVKTPGGVRTGARPLELICKALASGFFKIFCIKSQPRTGNGNLDSGWCRRLEGEGARTHVGQMAGGVLMIIFIVGINKRVTILTARRSLHLARCGCGRAASIAVVVGAGVGAVVASPRRGGLRSGAQFVLHASVRPTDGFN